MAYKTHLSCPIQRTMSMIADKWKVIVISILGTGRRRFAALMHEMNGITPKVLTRQLRDLEADGLVSRTVFPEIPPRVEYALTPLGESLYEALRPLYDWACEHAEGLLGREAVAVSPPDDSAA